jgi:molybdopterin-guanine dinucleotide biosynthesis protein A
LNVAEYMAGRKPTENVTAIVLAGGRATRMGGEDKGLIEIAGRPMIAHVIQAMRPQVHRLLINANRNLEAYARFGCEVVPDLQQGFLGPLAGLATGMAHAGTDYVVTAPCDSPLVAPNLVERLYCACRGGSADIAVAHDGRRLQPVFAMAHRDLAPDLHAWLAAGERKIDRWFARHRVAEVDFSDQTDTFINVNDPQERAALQARLAGSD